MLQEFCAGHKKEGMVNVVGGRCCHQSCIKHAAYGLAGSL